MARLVGRQGLGPAKETQGAQTEREKSAGSSRDQQRVQKTDSMGANLRAIEKWSAGFKAFPSGHKPNTGGTGAKWHLP